MKYYDQIEGSGFKSVKEGDAVKVIFEAFYKVSMVVSNRNTIQLPNGRTFPQYLSYKAGGEASPRLLRRAENQARKPGEPKKVAKGGQDAPEPPAAVSRAVLGMKKGGKRVLIVPPELGFQEADLPQYLPPDQYFRLSVEVSEIG